MHCALPKRVAADLHGGTTGVSSKKHGHATAASDSVPGHTALRGVDGYGSRRAALGHHAARDGDVVHLKSGDGTAPRRARLARPGLVRASN